jgi:hypothetical protein
MSIQEGHRMADQSMERPVEFLDISILWRKKWAIAFSVMACVGMGFLYLQQAVPVFEGGPCSGAAAGSAGQQSSRSF